MDLGATVGEGCRRLHDKLVRHVPAKTLEVDENWSIVGRHERRKLKTDPSWFGDQYTLFAIDPDTKLVPSYETGKRTLPTATRFMEDLHSRVDGKPQITFDGWDHWIEATRRTFGHRGAHVGTTVKEYQKACRADDTARGCGRVKSQKKTVIYGRPNQKRISTSKAERFNLTARMTDRRRTRLTNAYSKNLENHEASTGLHFFWYNFVRRHESLGTTPAVKAGIADHEWTVEEMTKAALAEMGAEAPEAKGRRRNFYQRKSHTLDADKPPPVRRAPVALPPTDDESWEEAEAPREARRATQSRGGERGFVTLGALSSVGLAAVGVLATRPLDEAIHFEVFGLAVPGSALALGASIAGAALAHRRGRRDLAGAAASLAVGLGTGMLGRAAARRLPFLAPAPAGLSDSVRAPLWKRALRWIFG
jgi:IS1 family transposase